MCVCVWLAHDPTIDGLDPSIVVQPRGLHLSLGVLTLATDLDQGEEAGETTHDLAGATQLLVELAPRVHAALERAPLCKLTVMQPDPTRAHVLYSEPDLSSTDGRRLRAVCGTLCSPCYPHASLQQTTPELDRDAFTEAGFLSVERRPLKVRSCTFYILRCYMGCILAVSCSFSYTARSSIRITAARPRASDALPDTFPSPSRHCRPTRMITTLISARGRYMSCRYVRWGAGHRMGLMCGSLDATFGLGILEHGVLAGECD